MLCLEAEAKGKWCPFGRALGSGFDGGSIVINRAGCTNESSFTPCIASACMAWRWQHVLTIANDDGIYTSSRRPTKLGYCGNADTPHGATLSPGEQYPPAEPIQPHEAE